MIKRYEVEEIITSALEELNGVFSKPNENWNLSLYEATVDDKGNGILEFSFKEDMLDKNEIPTKYKITIELQ